MESASESKVRRTEPFLFLGFIATPLFRWNHWYKNSAYHQNTLLRPGRTKEAPQSPDDSVGFSPLLNTLVEYRATLFKTSSSLRSIYTNGNSTVDTIVWFDLPLYLFQMEKVNLLDKQRINVEQNPDLTKAWYCLHFILLFTVFCYCLHFYPSTIEMTLGGLARILLRWDEKVFGSLKNVNINAVSQRPLSKMSVLSILVQQNQGPHSRHSRHHHHRRLSRNVLYSLGYHSGGWLAEQNVVPELKQSFPRQRIDESVMARLLLWRSREAVVCSASEGGLRQDP